MLFQADAALIPFADKTFHTCVTSPPYWGLRKYSGEQGRGMFPNLGLEPTPQEHIQHIVEIFREVKRVLRDDGCVWLNYGDCYAGSAKSANPRERPDLPNPPAGWSTRDFTTRQRTDVNIPAGNLMLMPHRIAIALQDDGWVVRNDLIWMKRNPMPESCAGWRFEQKNCECGTDNRIRHKDEKAMLKGGVTKGAVGDTPSQLFDPDCVTCHGTGKVGDPILKKGSWRHTRAHEYVFQLVKGPKMRYWCNQEAVREATLGLQNTGTEGAYHDHVDDDGRGQRIKTKLDNPAGRNPRSVLDVPTHSYRGAHYATFPPNLIAPLIRASCPRRACPECGQGWSPVVEDDTPRTWKDSRTDKMLEGTTGLQWGSTANVRVLSYRPTCECERRCPSCDGGSVEWTITCPDCGNKGKVPHDPIPGIVLDPFIGSGTTGAVARELQRRWVGLDISMEYLDEQAKIRALNWTPSHALDDLPLFNL